MGYLTVETIAKIWGISERSVRDYCSKGRVIGAILKGKTWMIPEDSKKPARQTRHVKTMPTLIQALRREKESKLSGGIYHRLQIDMTYNSNHIEGSKLTHEQTRFIFETRTIGVSDNPINIDDIIETTNHFRCIDLVIDNSKGKLTESFIKQLHFVLKQGTKDSSYSWFKVGDYKMLPNEVGGKDTTSPEDVKAEIKSLLLWYNALDNKTFEDIIAFHKKFEDIHPFQDGNGRVGRLIILKECLATGIVPPLLTDDMKMFYYRGLKEYYREPGYLLDTFRCGQDRFIELLDHFGIRH